jgi:Protein of unknown function (DUF3379)
MNHNHARLLIGADPGSAPPELTEHLETCTECAQFQREMRTLDASIRLALEQEPTAGPAAVTSITSARAAPQRKPVTVWSGWALAASVAVLSVLVIWAVRPSDTLAHDLVTHVEYERSSWNSKDPAPPALAQDILTKAGVALDMKSDDITYARTCFFRGHFVPHLVVKTAHGPITVLILPDEKVKSRMSFHEDGMSGVITPAPHGSIAVLAQGNENIDSVAQQVRDSVRWLNGA